MPALINGAAGTSSIRAAAQFRADPERLDRVDRTTLHGRHSPPFYFPGGTG